MMDKPYLKTDVCIEIRIAKKHGRSFKTAMQRNIDDLDEVLALVENVLTNEEKSNMLATRSILVGIKERLPY